MDIEKILNLFSEYKESKPNRFTRYMGNQIREARNEAGFSQEKLAKKLYLRRPTLSNIENGKVEVDASTLELLSYYLKKPLTYFFQKPIYEELVQKDMDDLSLEMQMHFEQIYGDELKRLLIEIVKKFGEFDPTEFVIDLAPKIFARLDRKGELEEYLNKRSKKGNK